MGNFLLLEPFYGGSHKYFADGLVKHSNHKIDLLTLPDKFWKWRMRGASLYFADKVSDFSRYDGIITSNMLSLADLKAVSTGKLPPTIIYFHENQILYPLPVGEKEDLHYGFTDITSAVSADHILFNSEYHKNAFIDELQPFLSRFPDNNPYWVIDKIKDKITVIHPGCTIDSLMEKKQIQSPPLIIWNHRWEYDKNPEDFFKALFQIDAQGLDFQLAVLGEQYKKSPKIFDEARKKLQNKIIHFGYVENYREYQNWLNRGDIIISTSFQENFGISVVEAIGSGSFPLLPNRLSYKELIQKKYHNLCIYKNQNDLIQKLKKLITFYDIEIVRELQEENLRFSWKNMISQYDSYLTEIIKKSR